MEYFQLLQYQFVSYRIKENVLRSMKSIQWISYFIRNLFAHNIPKPSCLFAQLKQKTYCFTCSGTMIMSTSIQQQLSIMKVTFS